MGLHYVNGDLVGDGDLNAAQPGVVIYAQVEGISIVGLEYLVLAEDWDATHDGPTNLVGQLVYFVGAPNRYRNHAFYELRVWAGKDNPHDLFAT